MSRVAPVLVLLLWAQVAPAADLPPGALARLGDDRFRAGSAIEHLAISPDGKQYATVRYLNRSFSALTLWDTKTGYPVRDQKVNSELFKGFVWGPSGALAVFVRADKERLYPDDFCVWVFTDPKAEPPPVLPTKDDIHGHPQITVERPEGGDKYTDFYPSADGRRVAARWKSAKGKYAVHVFELAAADSVAKLKPAGTIDLGAEGADWVRISADGETVVTFRALKPAELGGPLEETATVWDVASEKPERPVRVPYTDRPLITPDVRALVVHTRNEEEGGHDLVDLSTGKRRKLIRWPHSAREGVSGRSYPPYQFFPSGRVLVDGSDRSIALIDLTTGKELGLLKGHPKAPSAIAVSADGTCIATADDNGLVRLWDAKTLRPLNDAPGHRRSVEYAQLSPDGKRLLTWAGDDTVRLWDLATGNELRAFAGLPGIRNQTDRPTFTPDGTTILYSTSKHLIARDIQTGLEVPLPGDMAKPGPRGVAFSPDGKSAATWTRTVENEDDTICDMWDWPSGKKRFSWDPLDNDYAPGFSSDGSAVFDHPLYPGCRRDAKTGKNLPVAWKDNTSTFSQLMWLRPNPCWVLRESGDLPPEVIDAGTGKPVPRFRFGSEPFRSRPGAPESLEHIALSPTGGQYARAAEDRPDEVHVVESATRDVRRTLSGHRGFARLLGFTPDGTKLLTAGGDHTVLVWDMRLQNVPLPDAVKKETSAAKLWDTLAAGNAKDAYLAMARLAREPDAALAMAKMRLKPAATAVRGTDAANVADARAAELLEALDTDESRLLLKELAGGHADAFRTQEAKRALERHR